MPSILDLIRLDIARRIAPKGFIDLIGSGSAHGLLSGVLRGAAPPHRGTRELLAAYRQMPWLRAVTSRVATSVASTTWTLYVSQGRDGRAVRNVKLQRADAFTRRRMLAQAKQVGELREIEAHPLRDLIDNANPMMTGRTARQISQAYLDLKGEVFWVLERNGAGAPAEIWPVPPHWVTDTPSATRPMYCVSFRGWRGEIPESEMVWLRDPDLENPYGRGAGIAEALGDEIETDEYAAKHTKAWFYNRAIPELLIGVEQGSEEELKRAKQRWEDEHRGFFRAYRTHWHKGKLDVVQLGQSFQNMQLVDLRRFERDTIVNVFGVPPEILGIVENSNRSTIDASDYLFSRWVLVPRLEFLRAEMQERLVPMFDERLILDYESPVPEDREYNLNVARAAPYAVTVDEFRTMMGLEELPDGKGKVFMVPFSLVPMSSFGGGEGRKPEPTSQPSTPASDGGSEAGEGDRVEDGTSDEDDTGDQGKGATRPGRKDALPDRLVQDAIEAVSAEHLVFEANPIYKRVLEDLGQRFLDDLGLEVRFDLLNPRVIDFLEHKCGLKIKGINTTTREALRTSLAEGVRAGESIPDLAKRVSEVFSQAKGWRATTIARTEVVGGSNFANWEAMRQSGVIEEKEWIATRDDRVRDSHIATDGQIKPINEPFVLGSGVETMYPGASGVAEEDINCRCTTAGVVDGKTYLDTEEKRLAYWRKYDRTIRPYERQFESAMKRAFQKQQNAVMEVLKEYREGEE